MMRLAYIDKLKGLALFFVVMGHVSWFACGIQVSVLSKFYTTFFMPLFFFISGMFAFKSLKKWDRFEIVKFFRNKTLRILFPFFSFGALYAFIYSRTFDIKDWFLNEIPMYWFFPTLFLFMLSGFVVEFAANKIKKLKCLDVLLFVLLLLAVKMQKTPDEYVPFHYVLKNYFHWIQYFIFGVLFCRYDLIKRFVEESNIVYSISMVLWGASFFVKIPYSSIFAIIVLYQLFKRYDEKIPNCLSVIGTYSLEIYALHFFFIPSLYPVGDFLKSMSQKLLIEVVSRVFRKNSLFQHQILG